MIASVTAFFPEVQSFRADFSVSNGTDDVG